MLTSFELILSKKILKLSKIILKSFCERKKYIRNNFITILWWSGNSRRRCPLLKLIPLILCKLPLQRLRVAHGRSSKLWPRKLSLHAKLGLVTTQALVVSDVTAHVSSRSRVNFFLYELAAHFDLIRSA